MPGNFPDKAGWGHSTVDQALELAAAANPGATLLFSHDPDRSDDELDGIAAQARAFAAEHLRGPAIVAVEGTRFALDASGLTPAD